MAFPPWFFICSPPHGDEINTKSRGHCWRLRLGGALVVPTVGKQVFLRVVTAIPTVMRCMTPAMTTVKKVRLAPVQKQLLGRSPSPALPKGRESIPAVFEAVGWCALPLGRVGEGLSVGWVGLTLNTIIPASTWTDGNDLWVNYEKCIDAAMLNSISGGCSFQRNECLSTLSKLRCYHHIYKYRIHYHIRHPACISLHSNKCTGQYYTICP